MLGLLLIAALQVPFPCPGHWEPADPDDRLPGRYITIPDAHTKVVDRAGKYVGVTGDEGGTFRCVPGEGEDL